MPYQACTREARGKVMVESWLMFWCRYSAASKPSYNAKSCSRALHQSIAPYDVAIGKSWVVDCFVKQFLLGGCLAVSCLAYLSCWAVAGQQCCLLWLPRRVPSQICYSPSVHHPVEPQTGVAIRATSQLGQHTGICRPHRVSESVQPCCLG